MDIIFNDLTSVPKHICGIIAFSLLTGCSIAHKAEPIIEIKQEEIISEAEPEIQFSYENLNKYHKINLEVLYEVSSIIREKAAIYEVCPYLLKALIAIESSYKPKARSRKGAIGLGQLMPKTAKRLEVNPYNIEENIEGAAKYLAILQDMFDCDEKLMLAAYNAGEHRVIQYNGIPPYKETRRYVVKVLKAKSLIIKDETIENKGITNENIKDRCIGS